MRDLRPGDGRLLAREVASVVISAIEERLSGSRQASGEDIDVVNQLLQLLRMTQDESETALDRMLPQVLESIGQLPSAHPPELSAHGLLTGREGTDNLLFQLRRELASCNRVDWLVSFIKLGGVKMLESDIKGFLGRGGTMRVATTAYMGATDPAAIELLASISREADRRLSIRFSREVEATRLHAKSYIHHRESGFGSAYIGSANLSRPALTDGLEWVVRLSQAASPGLWTKIEETFEQWWGDKEFEEYGLDSDHPTHAQFRELVAREKGAGAAAQQGQLDSLPIFDLQPKPFQQAILERIAVEREALGRKRHLIVAATGTGKTMIAAFDYRSFEASFRVRHGRAPRMLYVVHSERILRQARAMFAQVMRNLNFGGLLVGGEDGRPCDALFASIQSWNSKIGTNSLAPDYFDYVIVDEAHHGEAKTWKKLLEWITPKSLLGLTATPERADGSDITRHFEDRTTAELRLPDAIARRLLVPFRYFGVTDEIDLRDAALVTGGRYVMERVEQAYIERGDPWIEGVRRAIHSYVAEPLQMRAIGFCAGVAHARMLAAVFERARESAEAAGRRGMRAAALAGDDSVERRDEVIGQLRRGELQLLFVADLLNEGVDIPEVDTVLFMRPTDSLTIFLQQLGRGLRLCAKTNKECLTVLDFVGQYRREFRFADRLDALLTEAGVSIKTQVEDGFTALPPGCSITLEPIARRRVLEHIQAQLGGRREHLIDLLRQLHERIERTPTQLEFIEATGIDPREMYSHRRDARWTYTGLLHSAGLGASLAKVEALEPFPAGLRAVAALDDRKLAEFGIEILDALDRGESLATALIADRRLAVLLVGFGDSVAREANLNRPPCARDVINALAANAPLRAELRSLLLTVATRAHTLSITPSVPIPEGVPLMLHRSYTTDQVCSAFGWEPVWHSTQQAGVMWIPEHSAYLMLVTLDKDSESFTERTRYRDFAITPTEFHWQSQSTARPNTDLGRRIVEAKNGVGTMWLFVRHRKKDGSLGTQSYTFMGAFRPTKIEGMHPMSVTGTLANAMPPKLFELGARAR